MFKSTETVEHVIRASSVEETYRVKVVLPLRREDDSERFPVVYATDSDEFFGGISTLAYELQLLGETPRFILVAIGYATSGAADLLRMRDLFDHTSRAHYIPLIEQLAASPLAADVNDLSIVTQTTDAADFLRFLGEELVPFINARFPVIPDNRVYYGYSAGATFGLYALFKNPDTFKRYILGSPATSHNGDHFGIGFAKSFLDAPRAMNVQVFLTVGELEELQRGLGEFEFVTGYYKLVKFLNESSIPGLDLTARLFSGETHATAWTLAFSHGLKAMLGPAANVPHLLRFDDKHAC
jgi:hypothetical protein